MWVGAEDRPALVADHAGPARRVAAILGNRLAVAAAPACNLAGHGRRLTPVAQRAVKWRADPRHPPCLVLDPRPGLKGRPVAHVLAVAALEVSHPLSQVVPTERRDPAFHELTLAGLPASMSYHDTIAG